MDLINTSDSVWGTDGQAGNISERPEVYIFHQTAVKVPLLLLYTVVFILAFFGEYGPRFPRHLSFAGGRKEERLCGPGDVTAMHSTATVVVGHG